MTKTASIFALLGHDGSVKPAKDQAAAARLGVSGWFCEIETARPGRFVVFPVARVGRPTGTVAGACRMAAAHAPERLYRLA